jgi:hypothetical protein
VPRSEPLPFPIWIPAAARRAIEDRWQDPSLDETARAALIRFATNPAMHTEVWEKLPKSIAGDVIQCVVIATWPFRERWAQYRREHPLGLDLCGCAGLATMMHVSAHDLSRKRTYGVFLIILFFS